MVRYCQGLIRARARKEMFHFCSGRAQHWFQVGNPALACDFLIRALMIRPKDVECLQLGAKLGGMVNQPELSERCTNALKQRGFDVAFDTEEERQQIASTSGGGVEVLDVSQTLDDAADYLQQCKSENIEIIDTKSTMGRGIFVKSGGSGVKRGDIILVDSAFSAIPINPQACSNCLRIVEPNQSVACPRCQEQYCSETCFEQAMLLHHTPACCNDLFKEWTESLQSKLGGSSRADSRVALTYLHVGRICCTATVRQQHPMKLEEIARLRGTASYHGADTLANTGALVIQLADALRQPNLYLEDFLSLCAIVQTNEFLSLRSGSALFAATSFFNHSCVPNAVVLSGKGGFLTKHVIALRDIAPGEQVFIDYNSEMTKNLSYEQRKKLFAERGFECFCVKCLKRE